MTEEYSIETIELPADTVDAWFLWINERGLIVLQYFLPESVGLGSTAILEDGVWKNIEVEGSVWTSGTNANSSGRIGVSYDPGDGMLHAAIYHHEGFIYLPDHPEYLYIPQSLSDHDLMTGAAIDQEGRIHGLLFDSSLETFEVFDPPFDDDSWLTLPFGINNAGVFVGYTEGDGFRHGFKCEDGSFSRIAVPDAMDYTSPLSINNRGEIAGSYLDLEGVGRGFLLRGEEFFDFFVPGSTWTAIDAITDRGQLSGRYLAPEGDGYRLYGFVATPVGNAKTVPAARAEEERGR